MSQRRSGKPAGGAHPGLYIHDLKQLSLALCRVPRMLHHSVHHGLQTKRHSNILTDIGLNFARVFPFELPPRAMVVGSRGKCYVRQHRTC